MDVTLDRNVFVEVLKAKKRCLYFSTRDDYERILWLIRKKKINAYISQASLNLESITNDDRIDKFFRGLVTRSVSSISPAKQDKDRIEKALSLGVKILHVNRISLGAFHQLKEEDWSEDKNVPIEIRQEAGPDLYRKFPMSGFEDLKILGDTLAAVHSLGTGGLAWAKGLVAEFDNTLHHSSKKKFLKEFRKLVGEWCDQDIICSHYSYQYDYICSQDKAKGAGSSSIYSESNILNLKNYDVYVLDVDELLDVYFDNVFLGKVRKHIHL